MLTHFLRLFLAHSLKPFTFRPDVVREIEFSGNNVGLYFHIPFCRRICDFCPYNKTLFEEKLIEPFIKSLIREIEFAAALMNNKYKINSIYFGGGTPALGVEYFSEILGTVNCNFNFSGHVGIELHPDDVTQENMELLKKNGFDMVSLGIQSFTSECLGNIGRNPVDPEYVFGLLDRDFITVKDVDLIFGIPGQTEKSLRDDFNNAVLLGATQISTYPFISFSYTRKNYHEISRKEQKKLLAVLEDTAKENGWKRTSIWTFSMNDSDRYSSVTRDNFLGFGPGAASLLNDSFRLNTFSVEHYIEQWSGGNGHRALYLRFTPRSRALYWLFWSAYSMCIDRKIYRDLFNRRLEDDFGKELRLGVALGFLEERSGNYFLTSRGILTFHHIEQIYTHQYIDKTWQACSKKAIPGKIRLY